MHFADEGGIDWEDGELENLIEQNKKDPDRYIEHDSNPNWGYLDGKPYVADCPCNSASTYESLFWKSRYLIRDYFKARSEEQQRHANKDSKLAREVSALHLG